MKGIKSTRLICPDGVRSGCVYWEGGRITAVTSGELPDAELWDAGNSWVAPGFIDLHTHGGGGCGFEDSVDDIVAACNFHLSHGTTCIYPTLYSAPIAKMAASAGNIVQAMKHPELKATVPGVHMEGPYFTLAQAGGQPTQWITPPIREDYLPILEQYGNYISRWDYAPETDEGLVFVRDLRDYGVLPGAAHTDALYSDMRAAMAEGLNIVTHLYSSTSTVTRDHGFRRLGVIETAWLEDDLYVEAIADGKHLPPELLRMIWKLKGSHRVALVTDSLRWAGMDKGGETVYLKGTILEDGVCKRPDRQAFQGSIATTDRLLQVVVLDAGIPMVDGVRMLTETPAAVMGLTRKGRLAEGCDADILVFDDSIRLQKILAMGSEVPVQEN